LLMSIIRKSLTGRHHVVHHRSPNQENRGGDNGAHSIMPGEGTALQEGERIQEPGPQKSGRIHLRAHLVNGHQNSRAQSSARNDVL
jgi:hypothetical protein